MGSFFLVLGLFNLVALGDQKRRTASAFLDLLRSFVHGLRQLFKGLTEVRRQPFTGHDEVHSRDCASLLGRLTEVSIEVSS